MNELQQVVFHRRYDKDLPDKGNPRSGWTYALTRQDLSQVLRLPSPQQASKLLLLWNENWKGLGDNQSNVDSVLPGIDEMRIETLRLLKSLE